MIGRLRHRVGLLRPMRLPDGGGGAAITWETVATVWAQVAGRTAGQSDLGLQERPLQRKQITLRQRTDITAETRFSLDGQTYRLQSSRHIDGTSRFMVLDIEEIH